MGNVCTPSYANFFIAQFEEKHVYLYIKDMSLLYLDILMTYLSYGKEQKNN